MEIYKEKYLQDFKTKLQNIIKIINTQCDCLGNTSDVLVVLSKVNFYAENFFINNELENKNNSEALAHLKEQYQLFTTRVKAYQKKYENGNKKALYELKKFLENWLEKPYLTPIQQ